MEFSNPELEITLETAKGNDRSVEGPTQRVEDEEDSGTLDMLQNFINNCCSLRML